MYDFIFYMLFGASILLAIVEASYSIKPTADTKEDTSKWHLREFFGMIITAMGVVMFALLAHENAAITENQCNLIIALVIILMPVRKIAILLLAQKYEKDYKNAIKIAYHIGIFLLSFIVFLVLSLFPGIFVTRIQVLTNTWTNIFRMLPGSILERLVVLVWLISLIVFVGLIINLIWTRNLGRPGMQLMNNITNIKTIVIMFVIRKIFLYIFVMDKYILKDIVFWIVIAIIGLIVLVAITMFRSLGASDS